jgi:hypothetical protein
VAARSKKWRRCPVLTDEVLTAEILMGEVLKDEVIEARENGNEAMQACFP